MLTAQRTAHWHDTKDHRRTELRTETRQHPGNAEHAARQQLTTLHALPTIRAG